MSPLLSNNSKKYHIPRNVSNTVNSVAKARANANGMDWSDFKERWRRRISNPYQFFAVSTYCFHLV